MTAHEETSFKAGNLVLYKTYPARVLEAGIKIEIELPDKKILQVRNKDITLLHPGPINSLDLPEEPPKDLREACEILAGETSTLPALAELLYGSFSPAGAWTVYKLIAEGLHLRGTPDAVYVLTGEEYAAEAALRDGKAREKEERTAFIERLRRGEVAEEDRKLLRDLEIYAYGESAGSRILKELGAPAGMEGAHALLIKLGVWDHTINPYIRRFGFKADAPFPPLEAPSGEDRLDLTRLEAFAVDDEGNTDPDDAVCLDGDRLWVHVADVAAAVRPDSEADIHARAQGANLYLPEIKVPMLPPETTDRFGLGIEEVSPALSFGIRLNDDGSLRDYEVKLTLIRVTRLSYALAQEGLKEPPFRDIYAFTSRYNAYRQKNGALSLRLPDVKIRVTSGRVSIRPLPETDSQTMVTDAMLMAGEAAARFALSRELPMPYTSQEAPDGTCATGDLAAMYACRRQMRPSSVRSSPSPHAGLGLDVYCRATSPLRRYLDLVVHQQIRAVLSGGKPLSAEEITNRIGASEAVTGSVSKLERLSNLHWTLVYLKQNPGWTGTGIAVEKRDRGYTFLLPEIGMETRVNLSRKIDLNEEILLKIAGLDIPNLTAHFEPA
jgi:exoribonuclease-2